MKEPLRWVVPLVLACFVAGSAWSVRSATSSTVDENIYCRLAVAVRDEHSFARFARLGVAPLPVIALHGPVVALSDRETTPREILVQRARTLAPLLVGLPLILVIHGWLLRRHGARAAALGGALVALSPSVLAHVSLAATDGAFALAFVGEVFALAWYLEAPSWRRLAVAAVSMGVAVGTKVSALALLPVAVFAVELPRLPAFFTIALLASWPCSAFELVEIVRFQLEHARAGHECFLMGERSTHGFWGFFPVAFAVKSTPTELLLALVASVGFVARARFRDKEARLVAGAAAIYLAATIASPLDLGHRFLLPIYPLLVWLGVDALAPFVRATRAGKCGAALLVLSQAASALAIAPSHLSYFNVLAGGPENGYRWLVDSSLDWGQDLPALAQELRARHARRPILAYFGTADPRDFGLESAVSWDVPGQDPWGDAIAISATYLEGLYVKGDALAPFRELVPAGRAGFSIFLYDPSEPRVAAALEDARRRAGAR